MKHVQRPLLTMEYMLRYFLVIPANKIFAKYSLIDSD